MNRRGFHYKVTIGKLTIFLDTFSDHALYFGKFGWMEEITRSEAARSLQMYRRLEAQIEREMW